MGQNQQNETLKYFKKHALEWKRKASTSLSDEVNIIKQRNDYVIKVIKERKHTDLTLDIGCGTGDLVCEIAQKRISALGIDFAKEMIDIAAKKAKKLGVDRAKFQCCSVLNYPCDPNKYDLISANGFIEYISLKELDKVLNFSLKVLKSHGSLILGSRNSLFNIFSLNKFTEEEIKEKNINLLLSEAIGLVKARHMNELAGLKTAPFQKKSKKHPNTDIKVSTRFQYTPVQLINILKAKGFKPVEVFPIHIHGVVPIFKEKYPAVHGNISNLLQNYAQGNMSLIPYASSFMIHVKKA